MLTILKFKTKQFAKNIKAKNINFQSFPYQIVKQGINFSPQTEAWNTFISLTGHGLVIRWHPGRGIHVPETSAMKYRITWLLY